MSIKPEDFTFSPKSSQGRFFFDAPNRGSISSDKILEHLELKKDRHEALKNYYLTVIDQLKDFTRSSIQQLEDQKKQLIDDIEKKFKDSLKDIRKRAIKKESELNEKLQEAVFHFDQTSILIKKLQVLGSEKSLIKEAEDNLKSWAREVEVKSSNVIFPVPCLTMLTENHSEFTVLSKSVQISGLISDISPLHNQYLDKLKLYVPFGYPEYSNYFILNLASNSSYSSIISALSQYFGLEQLALSQEPGGAQVDQSDKISSTTKELFLLIP